MVVHVSWSCHLSPVLLSLWLLTSLVCVQDRQLEVLHGKASLLSIQLPLGCVLLLSQDAVWPKSLWSLGCGCICTERNERPIAELLR